ncbi:hypothetical protein LDENG_00115480 [Lucifuga dentata]|nr:hypothetical protein LDENG_00115480 [Lucifuga dentata]
MIIHAFVSSHLDYCNSLFTCLSKASLDRLQAVQNAAAKLLIPLHGQTPPYISELLQPYISSRTSSFSDQDLFCCFC